MKYRKIKFGDACELVRGISYKSSDYSVAEDPDAEVFINLKCVTKDGFRNDGIKYYKGDHKNTQSLTTGDLLIANTDLTRNRAVIGNSILVPALDRSRACFSMDLCKINITDSSKLDKFYLYYYLKSPKARWYMINHSDGSTVVHLSTSSVSEMEMEVPSIEEQKKIVSILSSIDRKIACNNRTNDNLHDMAEILFREVYKKGHNGKLERFLSNIESGARPKGGAEATGVPSIGAEKIERFGIYDYSSEKYIGKDFYNKMKRGRIKNGDVLLYKDGAYTGKSSMVLDGFPHKEAAVNEHVFILNTENNFAQFYLYFCINIAENREKLHTLASGKAAQPGLNQSELGSIDIMIPDRNSILDFENNISPIMHQIASNAQENRRLTKLRDTLLPELLNGKIDISNIDV